MRYKNKGTKTTTQLIAGQNPIRAKTTRSGVMKSITLSPYSNITHNKEAVFTLCNVGILLRLAAKAAFTHFQRQFYHIAK